MSFAPEQAGRELLELIERLYPVCRSLTGDGVRETLRVLGEVAPIEVHEVPSGTPVLDWTVPDEWNVRDAYVADADGVRVVDFQRSNLHLVGYSAPFRGTLTLEELRPHLHSLPDQPSRVPYRTSYYDRNWGFCVAHAVLERMGPGPYEVVVDTELGPGSLTYGELVVPGEGQEELLLTAHVCHPSLANDNLSGLAIAVHLARELARRPRRTGVRILLAPGTIGSITWLARNQERLARIRCGLSMVCLGDGASLTYKRSYGGRSVLDAVAERLLRARRESGREPEAEVIDFFPYGYDERQFNAPAFRIPFGSLMRGRHGTFPEYHTSGDDVEFLDPERLGASLQFLLELVEAVDAAPRYRSRAPAGEPQLGRRGLYRAIGGDDGARGLELAMLWILSMGEGSETLPSVASRSGLDPALVERAAALLREHQLIEWPFEGRSSTP